MLGCLLTSSELRVAHNFAAGFVILNRAGSPSFYARPQEDAIEIHPSSSAEPPITGLIHDSGVKSERAN